MAHIIRPSLSAEQIAKNFGQYLKARHVQTKGNIRIGTASRGLRGLIAAKDIPQGGVISITEITQPLSIATALKDEHFMNVLQVYGSQQLHDYASSCHEMVTQRIQGSFMFQSQLFTGMYMVHLILNGDRDAASSHLRMLDFMPRDEGNFEQLRLGVLKYMHGSEDMVGLQQAIASRHHISHQDFDEVLCWAMNMVMSRQCPISDKAALLKIMEGTQFHPLYQSLKDDTEQEQNNSSSAKEETADKVEGVPAGLTIRSAIVPIMDPLIGMVNHSDKMENAAVYVPRIGQNVPCVLCLRAEKAIKAGEEICCKYGADEHALKVFWGIDTLR